MKKKNTLTRWLLILNERGTVDLKNREVSSFAPLNRILDEVGFYGLEFFEVDNDKYFYTFEESERGINKSKVHVGKRIDGKLADMSDDDLKNLQKMKKYFFFSKKDIRHWV